MPAGIEAGSSEFFRIACLSLPCQRRSFRRIEANHDDVIVAAWFEWYAAQTGHGLVKTKRAQTRALEVNELKHHWLVAKISPKRYRLPRFVVEDQIQRDRRIQLLLDIHAFGDDG